MNTNVEVTYKFRPYDPQLPIEAMKGNRVVKCLYKENTATGKKAGENSYIQIPTAHISESVVIEQIQELAPYVVAFLQDAEDKVIKEAHKNKSIGFGASYFSLDKILAYLDEQGQGNRLNKERIEQWFKEEMRDNLIAAFAAKMGISETPSEEELDKLAACTTAYQNKFTALAGGKTLYREEECELLQKALNVTEAKKSPIGERFYARLEKMKQVSNGSDLLDLL